MGESAKTPRRRKATTPEGRENQLIGLAVDLAEQQLRSGTASAQVLTHYLKLATEREKLEREKIHLESRLLTSRTDAINSQQRTEEMYREALEAMRSYSPSNSTDIED